MGDTFNLLGKIAGGAGVLIAIYLIWKNPVADATLLSGGTNFATSFAKTLQGR